MTISNDNGIFHKVTYPSKDSFHYGNINEKDIKFEEIEFERKIRGSQITNYPGNKSRRQNRYCLLQIPYKKS